MRTFETSATVQPDGGIVVVGSPFAPGAQVDILVTPKRRRPEEFDAAWRQVCEELRGLPNLQNFDDADIQREVDEYRAGR